MSKLIPLPQQWKRGQSGNPSGRPKGFKAVAKLIMEETGDGEELVYWALKIWRDVKAPSEQRWQAFQWLSDRGLGKPVATLDLNVGEQTVGRDLSALTDAQLEAIDAVFTEAGVPLLLEEGKG